MSIFDWFTIEREDLTPLPKEDYLFGPRHVFVLCLIVIVLCLLTILFRDKPKKTQDKMFGVLVGIMIGGEILVRIARMLRIIVLGTWQFSTVYYALIPAYMCSIVVWTLIINHFAKSERLAKATAVAGLIATGGFYLWPGAGFNTVELSFIQLYSIISHATALIYLILQLVFKRTQLKLREYYLPWIYFAVVLLYSWGLNLFIFPGANYMYFMYDNMTYWAIPSPQWQILLFFLLAGAISVFYIPNAVKVFKARTRKA